MNSPPEWIIQLQQAANWTFYLRLTLAALMGGIIGAEREYNGHPAGLRTNILVAVGACLFTILSIHAFPLVGTAQDTGRVAAQIVSGIGFLGAGAVIQTRANVHGLTTAATIWLVAAVGMAAATELYLLAIITTILTTITLALLNPLSYWLAEQGKKHRKRQGKKSANSNESK